MPHQARIRSQSGIYHVMLRGVNHQQLFFDENDFAKYISLLERFKDVSGYKIYAYCLMGNHIHILIKEGNEPIGKVFQRIGPAFANWYNAKYQRCGHIFGSRFLSEPVETDSYFLTVLRYILRNPVKAGICDSPADYKYSNAKEILYDIQSFTDTDELFLYFSRANLCEFLLRENKDKCLELNETVRPRMIDEAVIDVLLKTFGTLTPNCGIRGSSIRETFSTIIRDLKEKGAAILQLSRLTGIPRRLLYEMC